MDHRLWIAACATLVFASQAFAQDDERARVHFESGRSYFSEGAYERALEEFERAYALSPRDAMLFNIGTTQERLGLYAEAAATFERYVAAIPDDPNRAVLERRIENNRQRAAGRRVEPEAAVPEPGADPAVGTGGGGDGLVLGGAIALGVGGAALLGYAILGGLVLAEQGEIESGCFQTRSCTPADVADLDAFALGADIMWPIGLAAAAVGAVLIVLGVTASGSERAALELMPYADQNGAGVSARGSF